MSNPLQVIVFLLIFLFTFSVLGMVLLGGQLFTPIDSKYQIRPGALVYFQWNIDPSSYIQSKLLATGLPETLNPEP